MSAFTAHRAASRARDGRRAPFGWLNALLAAWLLVASGLAGAETARWAVQADVVFRRMPAAQLLDTKVLAQDGQGLMWLGTQNGLRRWDGYRAHAYQADPQNPAALRDNFVIALHTDSQGRLWIGTAAGGLARHDAQHDTFVNFPTGPGGLSSPSVWAIEADGGAGLWLGTGVGLDHLDLASGALTRVPLGMDAHGAVKAVLPSPDGGLWLGTERGLLRRAPGSGRFVEVPLGALHGSSTTVIHLVRDSAARLWIGTEANGAYVLEPGQSVPRPVLESHAAARLTGENIRSIVEVNGSDIWLGTSGGGIVVVDTRNGWRTHRLHSEPALPTSLADDDIWVMFRDCSGLVWVSSNMAMNVHDPRERGISTLYGSTAGDKPITGAQVPFVMMAADGRAWLSVGNGGGVDILDPAAGRVGQIRPDPAHPRSALPNTRVLTMVAMPDGSVFIGTQRGLYRSDVRGRDVVRVDVPGRAVDAGVWSLAVDDQVLWLGGLDGLWGLDMAHDGAVLRHEPPERLGGPKVTAILRGPGRSLWVGTSAGVARVDLASDAVERMPVDVADPTALPGNYAASLMFDAGGRLWVASYSAGLQVLERRDADGRPRFHRIGVREGLPHGGVDMLLADKNGQIWVTTDDGVAVVDPATYMVRAIGEAQGLAIPRYWTNAGARTVAGELLFGGQGGLTVIRPDRMAPDATHPPLVMTEVLAGGKLLVAGSFAGAATAPAERTARRLDIAAKDPNLRVEFAVLDYAAPEFNRYSYRLRGFDADWTATDAGHRVAAYTNLPPGDYTLELRGFGHDAPATPAMLDIPVRVLPAWYQTAAARIVGVLMGLLLIAMLVHVRTRVLRRRQHELQAQVDLRTAELQASQQQLELIAYADPLTGLDNRRRFTENLSQQQLLALRGKVRVTLLLIDLDHFKQINDSLGHDAGDALLVEVAHRLGATLRSSDRIARLGGDEFAVLLAATGEPAEVNRSCQRIVQSLMQPFNYRGHVMQVGASIGAATCPDHALDAEALYKCADLALYAAKNSGRNTWRLPAPLAEAVG